MRTGLLLARPRASTPKESRLIRSCSPKVFKKTREKKVRERKVEMKDKKDYAVNITIRKGRKETTLEAQLAGVSDAWAEAELGELISRLK